MKSFSVASAALMLVAGANLWTAEAQTNPQPIGVLRRWRLNRINKGRSLRRRPSGTNINTTTAGRRVILAGSRRAILLSDV